MKTLYTSANITLIFSLFFIQSNLNAQCSDPAALNYDSGATEFHDISLLILDGYPTIISFQ
ncbi:MAG: hypothetical protein CM15mP23_18390 [Cryomorphaceae bacterium]|nr:MAG: hypothetical protein CM15mP23_18390 [Cryomorphaceae bacterium]